MKIWINSEVIAAVTKKTTTIACLSPIVILLSIVFFLKDSGQQFHKNCLEKAINNNGGKGPRFLLVNTVLLWSALKEVK